MAIPGIGSLIGSAASYLGNFLDSDPEVAEDAKIEEQEEKSTAAVSKNIDMSSVSGVLEEGPKVDKSIVETDHGEVNISYNPENGRSENAHDIQEMLVKEGYLKEGGADGVWGKGSQKALEKYRAENGIDQKLYADDFESFLQEAGISQNSYSTDEGVAQNFRDVYGREPSLAEIATRKKQKTNLTKNGKKIEFTRGEASSGGDLSPALIETAKEVLPDLKELGVRVTGGNDAYHQSDQYYAARVKNYKTRKNDPKFKNMTEMEAAAWGRKNLGASKHADGNSMDFVVDDPAAARLQFIEKGAKYNEKRHTYTFPDGTVILDEYATKTSGGTAPHFHMAGGKGKKHSHKH